MGRIYGVVLVGCGYIGEEHLADIYYRDEVRLIAVVDTDVERARTMARKYSAIEYSTDYTSYLKRSDVDIVIVATYVDSHLSIMRDCVAAGKHVLCEKPVAVDRKDGEEFFRIAENCEAHVLVGHILRYNKSYRKIKELIDSGVIGTLRFIHFVQNHHALNWTRYRRLLEDCSPVVDCGVHYLDVMQWMSGQKIEQVKGSSFLLDADAPRDNFSIVSVKLSGECCGCYESGWSRNLHYYNRKEFMGDKGYIKLTLQADRLSDKEEGDLIEIYHSDTGVHEIINLQTKYKDMYAQFREMINMIEGHPESGFTLQDAKAAFFAAVEADEDGSAFGAR